MHKNFNELDSNLFKIIAIHIHIKRYKSIIILVLTKLVLRLWSKLIKVIRIQIKLLNKANNNLNHI